jgi:hypothetical protein
MSHTPLAFSGIFFYDEVFNFVKAFFFCHCQERPCGCSLPVSSATLQVALCSASHPWFNPGVWSVPSSQVLDPPSQWFTTVFASVFLGIVSHWLPMVSLVSVWVDCHHTDSFGECHPSSYPAELSGTGYCFCMFTRLCQGKLCVQESCLSVAGLESAILPPQSAQF